MKIKNIDHLRRRQKDRKFTKKVLNLHWRMNSKSDRDAIKYYQLKQNVIVKKG